MSLHYNTHASGYFQTRASKVLLHICPYTCWQLSGTWSIYSAFDSLHQVILFFGLRTVNPRLVSQLDLSRLVALCCLWNFEIIILFILSWLVSCAYYSSKGCVDFSITSCAIASQAKPCRKQPMGTTRLGPCLSESNAAQLLVGTVSEINSRHTFTQSCSKRIQSWAVTWNKRVKSSPQ